jgi:probable HAF family extracellular repeat protein
MIYIDPLEKDSSFSHAVVYISAHMKIYTMRVLMFALAMLSPSLHAKTKYLFTDLGSFAATALNDRGQAAGVEAIASGGEHAAIYSGGRIRDLGTLGGASSQAASINNLGQVVGSADLTGSVKKHAFLYQNGVMQDLGTLGGDNSYAWAINDFGVVVGDSETTDGTRHAFLYQNGHMKDLDTMGSDYSSAKGINLLGRIVGQYQIPGTSYPHAFLYDKGAMHDLGTFPTGGSDGFSGATAINDLGVVIGDSLSQNGGIYAFVSFRGKMQDLGSLYGWDSYTSALNDRGQIVGQLFDYLMNESVYFHAFLYENGQMQDFNNIVSPPNLNGKSGWTWWGANAVNNLGQVILDAINGEHHRSVLLTPISLGKID